jgi:hypothetical protein
METSTTTTTIAATTTYTDVITKFRDLKNKYYTESGCMISTLYDNFVKKFLEKHPNLLWEKKYNSYAETDVLTAKINVIIFGKPFVVYLHRPIKQVHRWEYENFFGFGGHNEDFSYDRIIATFQERFDENIDIEYLLMTGTLACGSGSDKCHVVDDECRECCVIDEKYIKNTLKLLVVGGYVKRWAAFNEFKEWFKESGFNLEFDINTGNTLTSFMFEDYEVVNMLNKNSQHDV